MKIVLTLIAALVACQIANAQLTVYSSLNQQGNSGTCVARTIYKTNDMPSGLDNIIKSIALKKGFMATVADKPDGTGESFCYMAVTSDLNVNLANVLRDKVSFIRVLPITNVKKKGAGEQNNNTLALLNASWFYDWGPNDVSVLNREFVPMAWGRGSATPANVDLVTTKTGFTHYLSFNEPDGVGQANMGLDESALLYKNLLGSGYRMGSPACTEAQYRLWLADFKILADRDTSRIDFIAIHWYDWGNWLSTSNANPDANALFTRFKNHITAVYNLFQKPIWITEFNANINRPTAVQEAFMALALPWLDADPRVERYAYFFPPTVPAVSTNGALTAAGRAYANHVSTDANPANIFDRRAGATIVSVAENTEASFTVYPSIVSNNKIEATFKAISEAAQIKIFNLNGQLMSTYNLELGTTSKTIDIAHFTEGVYVLVLQDKGYVLSRKFVKQ
jgi:Glycosyl hydrolase catalytic core/Secretion system C-terminal sorting domain